MIQQRDDGDITQDGGHLDHHGTRAAAQQFADEAYGPQHQHVAGRVIPVAFLQVKLPGADIRHVVCPGAEGAHINRETGNQLRHPQSGEESKQQYCKQQNQGILVGILRGLQVFHPLRGFGDIHHHARKHQINHYKPRGKWRAFAWVCKGILLGRFLFFPGGKAHIRWCFLHGYQRQLVKAGLALRLARIAAQARKDRYLALFRARLAVQFHILPVPAGFIHCL